MIDVFEDVVSFIDSRGAMIMLEKMRKYWNSVPHKRIDIHSWSYVINCLIYKIKESEEVTKDFIEKYPNLLYLNKIMTVSQRNRRNQARSWLKHQDNKYVLVKETFKILGYSSIEQLCEKNGGFAERESVNEKEKQCFNDFGNVVKYHVREIHLKRSVFSKLVFYDALTTYVHEMCHMFGGDSSDSFSLSLTNAMEILLLNHEEIMQGYAQWNAVFSLEA